MNHPIFSNYKSGSHMPVLDGVRGLAVSLVLAFHFFGLKFGWLGVDLFFVLSGFLITGILIDSKSHQSFFKNFYAKRTLRIFPLYYIVLSVFFIIVAIKGFELRIINPQYFLNKMVWFITYTQNWLWTFNDWPQDKMLDHFWSLAVEEQFYLFWPFIVYLLPTRKLIYAAVIMIAIAIAARYLTYHMGSSTTPVQYINTVCRLDCLSIGACIAILIRTNPTILARLVKPVFIITLPLLIYVCYKAQTFKYDSYWYLTIGFTLFDLMWGVLLIVCFTNWVPMLNKFFSSSIMRWLGKYSYGIYVYHWIIYAWAFQFIKTFLKTNFMIPVGIPYGIICLIATLLISKISYDYFEAPLLKLKKKFEK